MNRLSDADLAQFIEKGFVKLSGAVPQNICEEIVSILWKDTGVDRHDPSTWTKPVIRLWYYDQEPFRVAVNMPALHEAFDQLVGKGNWAPRNNLGSFPIRFPINDTPGDDGWHVDASYPGSDSADIFTWRINVHSKDRALLMLFIFSDVGELDAPTRISVGSHKHIAKILAEYGHEGLTFAELAKKLDELPKLPEMLATGTPGTVYLCHPFLVHAAQRHLGKNPKFMAQPPLMLKAPFQLKSKPEDTYPVEKAILEAMGG
jgi:hypothetical protein